jgi:hypothetical protein
LILFVGILSELTDPIVNEIRFLINADAAPLSDGFQPCGEPEEFLLARADEPDEPIAAEDGHDRHVAGTLKPLPEILIGAGRVGGIRAFAGVALEVRQQSVPELLQLDL